MPFTPAGRHERCLIHVTERPAGIIDLGWKSLGEAGQRSVMPALKVMFGAKPFEIGPRACGEAFRLLSVVQPAGTPVRKQFRNLDRLAQAFGNHLDSVPRSKGKTAADKTTTRTSRMK